MPLTNIDAKHAKKHGLVTSEIPNGFQRKGTETIEDFLRRVEQAKGEQKTVRMIYERKISQSEGI